MTRKCQLALPITHTHKCQFKLTITNRCQLHISANLRPPLYVDINKSIVHNVDYNTYFLSITIQLQKKRMSIKSSTRNSIIS